ncbi:MAG: ABC transporter ATP-binding protein [Spirochaetales bacterium]|uniref:ABC transporter ATP-binding protein n=1 Tax=Candidatus Thalassospirochaeta sargassi TaxID=3119039 RepID=A0AAJ1IFA8_9SPIO|nr:ABC transporter ATP-binding protein [Spirochaetales bacterium]
MPENSIKINSIGFSYQQASDIRKPLFCKFNMELPASRVSVILGPSGCGKTTLLNLINGLLIPDKGEIIGASGNTSVLFQEPRLLPWRTVRRNIEIVLNKHMGSEQSRATAEYYLQLVGLVDSADFFPSQLSGGMRQRVAIARAFAYPADTILMDEPFQALDLGLKINLTNLFTKLWVEDRRTSIFVTHDINEAILLGDEIFVFSDERPVQIIEKITNPEPHAERSLESRNSMEIEKKLYRLLS